MRKLVAIAGLTIGLWSASVQAAAQTGKPPVGKPKAQAAAVVDADTLDPVAPSIDHSAYDALLHKYVANGLVNYAAFHDNPIFEKYLATLNTIDPSKFEEPERIAFWLNVYNAYTIELIASHGETESIRNINKTFGVLKLKGPWSDPIVKAAGRTLTLDDVEHRILRHEFSEPRVHFAMSFGTLGGAPLRSEAYSGAKLDEQLDDQARIFILDSPTKNSVDTARYTLHASPILARYRSDFGDSPSALGKFLSDYFPDGPERRMLRPREVNVRRAQGDFGGGRGNVNATVTATGAKTDSAKPPAPPAPTRQFRSFFRIVETPFDWGLNIQAAGKQ
ncbi:MAG: DUF547 domain-containing protein [Gemmatimonadaceae bacterium]